MLKSRMELPAPDYSYLDKAICCCGDSLGDHDYPAGKCLVKNCDCQRFEQYERRDDE